MGINQKSERFIMTKKVLISVSDKKKLIEIASFLNEHNYEIYSTGGTFREIEKNNIPVHSIENYTQSNEIMNGRVKTIHPKIFGGILADKENQSHLDDLNNINGYAFDILIVNLYPFLEQAIEKELDDKEAIEFIDIGGPSLLRAAAKNFNNVIVLSSPNQYESFINEYDKNDGIIDYSYRKKLSIEVFRLTSKYDHLIANYLSNDKNILPKYINLDLKLSNRLRYGENPHQKSAFYEKNSSKNAIWSQVHGKQLSYNNYADIESAFNIVEEFSDNACCIIKHSNPCGFSIDKNPLKAFQNAVNSDPVSYFGGIVGFNFKVDHILAKELNKSFLECIVAPSFTKKALIDLKLKKNLRLLVRNTKVKKEKLSIKSVAGGFLVQEKDFLIDDLNKIKVVTKTKPKDKDFKIFNIGLKLIKYVKSNGIIFVKNNQLIGLGAGQTSRVDSVKIAVRKAKENGFDLKGAVMFSDAFFPFSDGIKIASDVGVKTVVQPGGSIKDKEVIEYADQEGIVMCFTGNRHFFH